jgi:hypothetical protein
MSDQSSPISNILLRQPVKISLHDGRAETLVLELGQDSERVDGDGAAFLLVSQGRIGGVVRWDSHVAVVDGAAVGFGGDDVAQQDALALGGAAVDRGGGGVCGDGGRLRGGEDAEGELGAFC